MSRNLNAGNALFHLFDKAGDIIILSFFWVIGCMPVLTIGTSTTALYYSTMKSIHEEGSISNNFWRSYKANLKQSVLVELILLALTFLLCADIRVVLSMEGALSVVLRVLLVAIFFLSAAVTGYLFPLLSRFVYSTPVLFRNALLISLSNILYTVVITGLNLLPLFLLLLSPAGFMQILLVMLFLAPGLIARINSLMFIRIFRQYMPEDALNAKGQES